MRYIPLLLLSFALAAGEAVTPDFTKVDAYALKAGDKETASVAALGTYLKAAGETPVSRARAAYRWICGNVAYGQGPMDPEGVLKARQAVCAGYAALYKALCDELGVPCAVVVGRIKHHDQLRGHAWNAIELDGAWHLVDATWGAGSFGPQGYRQRFEPGYFLADPVVMGTSHLPSDPKWQLREEPIDQAAFMKLPRLLPAFAAAGLTLESHHESPITVKGELTLTFKRERSDAARLTALLCLGVQSLPRGYVLTVNEDERATVRLLCPNPGTYSLWLLVDGAFAGTWRIVQTDERRNVQPDFPHFFGTYHESGVELLAPLKGTLAQSGSTTFRVRGGGGRVKAIVGGRPVSLRRVGNTDVYEAAIKIPSGEVYLALPGRTAHDWNVLAGFNLTKQ